MAGLFLCRLSAAKAGTLLHRLGGMAVRMFLALPSPADIAQRNMQGAVRASPSIRAGREAWIAERRNLWYTQVTQSNE